MKNYKNLIFIPFRSFTFNLMLQPFISGQFWRFERLSEPVKYFEAGFNLILDGQRSKLSQAIQNRPVFERNLLGEILELTRRNSVILQYQIQVE